MVEHEQSAFLLHSRPYRDHQKIVDLFTEYDGKVSAIVYVGQSPKSNKKALLQPFLPIKVSLSGKSSLKKLVAIESQEKSFQLIGNYLFSGFYINELLVKLLPELIPSEQLFSQYNSLLNTLNTQHSLEIPLRAFELNLLSELGVALDFDQLSKCHCQQVIFSPEFGFACAENERLTYNKQDLLALANNDYSVASVRYSAKQLMRQVFDYLLDYKPLNSRALFVKK